MKDNDEVRKKKIIGIKGTLERDLSKRLKKSVRMEKMSSCSKPRGLSREEKVELARSNKKVKDGHHAGFKDGSNESGHTQDQQITWGSPGKSFRDKLVEVISGAYAKAFDFTDFMEAEDEVESDVEMEDLHEGLAAVTLTKETKRRIRDPWSKALIVKLYEKSRGL